MLTLTQLSDLATNVGIDLFEGLQLPEGSPLDRNTVINSILMRCGLNFPNFADPYIMKSAIAVWSAKNQYTFNHVAKIYEAEYSPIENYDRYEDMYTGRNRNMSDDTTNIVSKLETINSSNNVTNGNTSKHTGTDTTTDETKTSAYDASTYQPENKTTSDLVHGETITDNGTANTVGTSNKTGSTDGKTDKDIVEKEDINQLNHIRGNIGVTTATQMESEEYEFVKNYNPYDFIAGLFENDLTLFVY